MIRSILLALLLASPVAGQEFRTISDQFDADNVSITGGSIDGVTLGATTPGSGAFTTLSTTDVMTLGSTVLSGASSNTLSVINGSADCAIRVYSEVGANAEYIALRRSGTAYFLDQAWAGSGGERLLYIRGLQLRLQSGGNTDQIGCFGGNIQFYADIRPSVDAAEDCGQAAARWRNVYASDYLNGGVLGLTERSSDPTDPTEGKSVVWQSDGTGSGDDGDIMVKITAGGVTKTITLIDFSAF